jgi:hypothetical protein
LPNSANDVAGKRSARLAASLAFGNTSIDVDPGGSQVVCLRQSDAIENGVQATVATSIQAVPYSTRGGSFTRGSAGVRRKLCIRREATSGSKDAGQHAGGEKVHAA